MTLALVGVSGCTSQSLVAGDGGKKSPGPDGTATDIGAGDPAACGCQVDGYVLTISWDCYCAKYDCTQPPEVIPCSATNGAWTHGCGYRELSFQTIGGLQAMVYTDAGQLIGAQLGSDTSDFTCPTDPSVHGYALRAGKFPLDTCEAQTPCPCLDGGVSCATPPLPDASTLPPPPDAAI